jgi:hypothetical protein
MPPKTWPSTLRTESIRSTRAVQEMPYSIRAVEARGFESITRFPNPHELVPLISALVYHPALAWRPQAIGVIPCLRQGSLEEKFDLFDSLRGALVWRVLRHSLWRPRSRGEQEAPSAKQLTRMLYWPFFGTQLAAVKYFQSLFECSCLDLSLLPVVKFCPAGDSCSHDHSKVFRGGPWLTCQR